DRASLSPLVEAGFEVASVLSPAQALARVVRARQGNAPTRNAGAAPSLNSHGAAIAIVAGVEVIQSRVFVWPLGTPFIDQWGDQRGDQPGNQRADQRWDKRGGRSELLGGDRLGF